MFLMMSCLSCSQNNEDESVFTEAVSISQDGEISMVSLMLHIVFPEYIQGNFFFEMTTGEGNSVAMETNVKSGWTALETTFFLPSNLGTVRLIAWNDFNGNGRQEEKLDPSTSAEFEVKGEDIEQNIRLRWPFENAEIYPKLAIMNLNPSLQADNETLLRHFAKASLLVLDHSLAENCSECISRIIQENPSIDIFLYCDPTSIPSNTSQRSRSSLERNKYEFIENTKKTLPNYGEAKAYMPGEWNGEYVEKLQYWPGSYLINTTSSVAMLDPSFFATYAELYDRYFRTFSTPLSVTGFLLDNVFDDISWVPLSGVNGVTWLDVNYDRVENDLITDTDGYYSIDRDLQEAWVLFLSELRRFFSFQIIGNEGNPFYLDLLNGKWFENAPSGAQWGEKAWLFEQLLKEAQGEFSIWHMVVDEENDSFSEGRCFSGLLTACLFGGYYACGNRGNNVDYDFVIPSLGRRMNSYFSINGSVFTAVFEKGFVLFNSSEKEESYTPVRSFYTKDGRVQTQRVTLPPYSGEALYYEPPE
jgi:hypothetical protein